MLGDYVLLFTYRLMPPDLEKLLHLQGSDIAYENRLTTWSLVHSWVAQLQKPPLAQEPTLNDFVVVTILWWR